METINVRKSFDRTSGAQTTEKLLAEIAALKNENAIVRKRVMADQLVIKSDLLAKTALLQTENMLTNQNRNLQRAVVAEKVLLLHKNRNHRHNHPPFYL